MTLMDGISYFTEGRMTVELADNVSAVVALDKIKAKIQVRTRGEVAQPASIYDTDIVVCRDCCAGGL